MPQSMNVLVIDDEPNIRKTLTICLENCGHRVTAVSDAKSALAGSAHQVFQLALLDIRLGTENGLELIQKLAVASPWMKIVVITAYASIEIAVDAMKHGAFDFLPKPFTPAQVEFHAARVAEVIALEQKITSLQDTLGQTTPGVELASENPAMQHVLSLAKQIARSEATVLLTGESGTGKSELARAIHLWSDRSDRPFSVIACPSIPAQLLESELFGHVEGAFTGATRDNPGRIASSEGGTVFLDEIAELPLELQAKLLRFVQERNYERVGEPVTRQANVRLIAASNQDLRVAVTNGRFREDLFYRLNVIQIAVPPLREHPEDIPRITERLLGFFTRQSHRKVRGFDPEARRALERYPWPGNIRELRNTVERTAILCETEWAGMEFLPPPAQAKSNVQVGGLVSLKDIEEAHIRQIVSKAKSLEQAAQILGIDQATLWRRRKEYKI